MEQVAVAREIDTEVDELITLAQACSDWPGRSISRQTITGYLSQGLRGIRLPSIWSGNQRWTSREAIAAFVKAVSEAPTRRKPPTRRFDDVDRIKSTKARRERAKAHQDSLAAAGVR